ncbi:hypothetical protein Hypma_013062 [Hypsizygus marmoreus]|uniref:Uncharacterized protein n=1 Tax=Hypsizygus marmoreus TaxID=39966 RepID=A0A369JN36_HYPMA|nr:hypothetical protein Hypma_013062 [Hypsizygus marmoreus]
MSVTLVPSMNKLQLIAKSTKSHPASQPHIPMPLPLPTYRPAGLRLFYGFDIHEEWLIRFADQHMANCFGYDPIKYDASSKMNIARRILINITGINNLTLASGQVDETAIANGTVLEEPECSFVPLLAVCSSRRKSYDSRPSRAQFERLQELIGRPAKWWIECDD